MISRPTGPLPVNAIVATSRWRTSAAPASPSPGTSAIAPAGTPPSRSARTTMYPQPGDCSAGLRTTVLPVARPAAVMPMGIAIGKFHGAITPTTPRGPVAHLVALARDLEELLAPLEGDGPAGVELEEVDRLADVGVRLGPRLRALADRERGEHRPVLPQPPRRPHQRLGAALGRGPRPRRERLARGTDGGVDVGLVRDRGVRDDAVRVAGVGRDERVALAAVVADPQRHAQRELRRRARSIPAASVSRAAARRSSRTGSLRNGASGVTARPAAPRSAAPLACSARNDSLDVFSSSRRTR